MQSTRRIKKPSSAHMGRFVMLVMIGFGVLYFPTAISQSLGTSLNVIDGTVTILDPDGNEIEDRSNIVIFIDGISTNKQVQEQNQIPKMSHQGRRFSPRVIPIVKGESVDFFNDDNIYHNVFSLSKAKNFDLGIYPQGTSRLVAFNKPGLIKIYCNIHPKMVSSILVLNNPLFAKAAIDGTFTIKKIPDGTFTLRLWYEFGDDLSQQVILQGGERFTRHFVTKITKKVRRHKNKFGKSYRKKY